MEAVKIAAPLLETARARARWKTHCDPVALKLEEELLDLAVDLRREGQVQLVHWTGARMLN